MLYDHEAFMQALPKEARSPTKSTTIGGTKRILEYAAKFGGLSKAQIAYILASVYHETATWMHPIREGGWRYGPDYTDANARTAVAALHAKGMIRVNYAKPDSRTGKSYYGRGLIQITWYDEYKQIGDIMGVNLVDDPDKALEWDIALRILFTGMSQGTFREGHSLEDITGPESWVNARDIVNGDKRKNGPKIATIAAAYYAALK